MSAASKCKVSQRRPPIALFAYRRLDLLQKTVESLKANFNAEKFTLYVFSDGAKGDKDLEDVVSVRHFLRTISGFKSVNVIEAKINLGLANSIISGVSQVLEKHDDIIVFEDDIISNRGTLDYFSHILNAYRNDRSVYSISGNSQTREPFLLPDSYPYDVFFTFKTWSWGWATWRDRWNTADWGHESIDRILPNSEALDCFKIRIGESSLKRLHNWRDGKSDIWACRWSLSHFNNNGLCVMPRKSLTFHIGNDGRATNSSGLMDHNVDTHEPFRLPIRLCHPPKIDEKLSAHFMDARNGNSLKSKFDKFEKLITRALQLINRKRNK